MFITVFHWGVHLLDWVKSTTLIFYTYWSILEVADKVPEAAIAEDGQLNSANPEEDGSGAVRKSFPETWIWVEGKSGWVRPLGGLW